MPDPHGPDPWAAAFARARGRDTRLLGWQSPPAPVLGPTPLTVTGRVPPGLRGTLYRNGPADHDRFGRRYRHWFDADGMVQRFHIDEAGITHFGRILDTPKRQAETRANGPVSGGFGTAASRPVRHPDDMNAANISLLAHGGDMMALWEAGSPTRLDPDSLAVTGFKSWSPALAGLPFTAHPKIMPDGTLWGFGYSVAPNPAVILYQIDRFGKPVRHRILPMPAMGMMHDFVVTERHLLLLQPPLFVDPAALRQPGTSFLDAHRWQPEAGMTAWMIDRNDFELRRRVSLPAGFFFHHGNGWEDADGSLHFDLCLMDGPGLLFGLLRNVMRGDLDDRSPLPALTHVTIPASGPARLEPAGLGAEFPRIDPRQTGRRHRNLYALTGQDGGWGLNAVVRMDWETGQQDRFDYGDSLPEEHLMVPDPAGGPGWVLGTCLDHRAGITELNIFEANHLAAGPVTRASLPYPLPMGLHGIFVHCPVRCPD